MFAKRGFPNKSALSIERHSLKWVAIATAVSALALMSVTTASRAGEPTNPAHALAEKFAGTNKDSNEPDQAKVPNKRGASPAAQASGESDTQKRARVDRERRAADEQRAYEEDMLSRARAEAEARLKADMAQEQDTARQRAEAELQARKKAEAEAAEQQHARERMQAEELARKAAEAERAEKETRQKAAAERLSGERESEARELAHRLRAARLAREEARVRAAAEAAAEANLQSEARLERARNALHQRTLRLSGKLEELKTRRELYAHSRTEPLVTGATHRTTNVGHKQTERSGEADHVPAAPSVTANMDETSPHRATVLLVMKPGTRGIRRWNKKADPMVCIGENCYISSGADSAARSLSRRKGFGPGIALGSRAGACNNQLACVYRDVDLLGENAWMQPVDLRIIRHDRRESRRISIDPTCAVTRGRLACARTIESDDYRAWIVPEQVARQAGPDALKAALENSLQGNLVAHSPQ